MIAAEAAYAPVRKSVTVTTSVERAFRVFTDGFDSWWPRTHHIGKSPMTKAIIEPFAGGRCFSQQQDGTDCPWGTVTTWDPPHRLVIAWQITPEWGYEPDLARASEVEIRFTAEADGATRVDLEHRHFERMGPGGVAMRGAVDGAMGWGELLRAFGSAAEQAGE